MIQSKLQKLTIFSTIALLTFSVLSNAAETVDVKKILDYSDRTRGGIKGGLEWDVTLQSWENDDESVREFKVKLKDNDSYVESLKPAKNKGEVMLFNTRSLWFYKPALSKPIAISARQKLTGVASNGDIASTAYARDYEGKFDKIEVINNEECYLLHLKSVAKDTTYDKIDYWISKKSGLGLKSNFLSLSGKIMKTASFVYKNKVKIDGKEYPFISEMTIVDAKNPKIKSVLTYNSPILKSQPDSLFKINNLIR